MKRKNKIIILCLSLFSSLLPLAAQGDPFSAVRDSLRDGSRAEEALTRLESLKGNPDLASEERDIFFEMEYYRLKGRILIGGGGKEEAREALDQCLALAEEENGRRETSRTLYYLAAAGFQKASLDGFGAVVSRSGELNDLVDRALLLDGNDPQLIFQKAGSLAYPPRLFGGDPKKAISLLEKRLAGSPLEKPFRFDLLSVLAHCYERENRKNDALAAAEQALALYPGNKDMIEKKETLEKK